MNGSINTNYIPKSFVNGETGELKVDKKLAAEVQAGVAAAVKDMPEAQKAAFLDMIAGLAPGDVDTAGELGSKLALYKNASEQLSNLGSAPAAFVGDIAKFLARAMMEQASQERKNALDGRLAAREQAAAQSLEQAGKLKDAAETMLSGAMTNMIMGIVSAAVSFAAAGVSLGANVFGAAKLGGMMNAGKATETAVKQLSFVTDSISAASKMIQAGADMGKSIGGGIEGKAQADAKKMEADAQLDAAQSQYAQQQGDMHKEVQDNMKQMMEQIINFIKEMQDAEVDAMRAITRG